MTDRLEGWFAVDRKSISHPFFKRSERSEYEAWIWLIAHAAWKETHHWVNGKRHDVKRGELFTTLRELQSAWMWSSDKKVRGFLKRLSEERMIDAETSHGKTQITICNYSLYQDIGRKKDAETSEKSPSKGQAKDALKEQTKQINNSSPLNAGEKDVNEDNVNRMLDALGVTDESKSHGLLVWTEIFRWFENGCDLEKDILPVLKAKAAQGHKATNWAYFTKAIFQAKANRTAPPPTVEAKPTFQPFEDAVDRRRRKLKEKQQQEAGNVH